jgi:hypothetical protein
VRALEHDALALAVTEMRSVAHGEISEMSALDPHPAAHVGLIKLNSRRVQCSPLNEHCPVTCKDQVASSSPITCLLDTHQSAGNYDDGMSGVSAWALAL